MNDTTSDQDPSGPTSPLDGSGVPVDPMRGPNVPVVDPARVARWEYLVQNTASWWPRQKAEAAMALADEEHGALVAEVERLRAWQEGHRVSMLNTCRALEAAESKVAKVEALADEWDSDRHRVLDGEQDPRRLGWRTAVVDHTERLRAALADAPAEQRAEGGA